MLKGEASKLPTVLVSSVVRSAHQGESHGGLYLVNMATGAFDQVIDWNDTSINWDGRGADRGLRGIAFHDEHIYLAASDEIFVYDSRFGLVESYRNRYLKHCHEIFIADDTLYLTSTGFDSVLTFDLVSMTFVRGYCLRFNTSDNRLYFNIYNPNQQYGPELGDTIHVNSVFVSDGRLFVASLNIPDLLYIEEDKLCIYAPIPAGSHNVRPFYEGVLLNDTVAERVSHLDMLGAVQSSFPVIRYRDDELEMGHLPMDHARQAFARGLCVSNDGWIIGGSSPSTLSAYRLDEPSALRVVNLTMDVRNSVHGLEIWPF